MSIPLRTLIVEDSEDDAQLLLRQLRSAGYDPQFVRVESREDMQQALDNEEWDLVISDYHLPSFDAPAALGVLRGHGVDLPFIVVSGAIGEETAVEAMKAGANDYLMKSNLARLGPAIERELREAEQREQRRRAERAVRRRNRELTALSAVAESLSDFLELDRILRLALERTLSFSGLGCGAIWLARAEGEPLQLAVHQGLPAAFQPQAQQQAEAVYRQGPQAGNQLHRQDLDALRVEGVEQQPIWQVGLPMQAHGSSAGMLLIGDIQDIQVSDSEVALLAQVAGLIGTAVQNAELFNQVRDGRDQLNELSRQLVDAQELERQRVARELHDEIGQLLTSLKLNLELARDGEGDSGIFQLGQAVEVTEELVSKVRTMSLDLRPAMLDDLGLLPALLWQFQRFQELTSIAVDFRHNGLDRRFETSIETAAYRIVQEALTNIARHANTDAAEVMVNCTDGRLTVEVLDHGSGFDLQHTRATSMTSGLTGMHQRASLLGGELTVETSPNQGTRLLGVLPLGGRSVQQDASE